MEKELFAVGANKEVMRIPLSLVTVKNLSCIVHPDNPIPTSYTLPVPYVLHLTLG